MTLTDFQEPHLSRKLCGGLLSAALHVVMLVVVLSGGREYLIREGDAPVSRFLLLAVAPHDLLHPGGETLTGVVMERRLDE